MRQVLPDLLRDLGAPFPAIWDQLHAAHGPREAARLFAKVLGHLDTLGADVVVLLLALIPAFATPGCLAPEAVPAHLRDLDIPSGSAADYDDWLVAVGA